MKTSFLFAGLLAITGLKAQDTAKNAGLTWSAFVDAYYSYDLNKPADHLKPFFLYNHNRHNEFNINLALIRAAYSGAIVRANLALMAGTYPEYNLAAEPEMLQHVFEANVGVRLSRTANLWVDAGIFPSHIGFESAVSKDNWTLSRSLAAEGSPYYEAGAKITYTTANNKVLMSALLLNGWQKIRRPDHNNSIAFGTQLTIYAGSNTTLNWSTFIGNDKPDSAKQMRYFNNFYAMVALSEQFGIITGLDIGFEKRLNNSGYNRWYAPVIILRYAPSDKWAFAARGEYYSDPNEVIVSAGGNGFQTLGASFNIDHRIGNLVLFRTEFRSFNSREPLFRKGPGFVKTNNAVNVSMAIGL